VAFGVPLQGPNHLPRHLLYRMIAYRLQAERLGDLDRDTQRFLNRVAVGTRNGDELPAKDLTRYGLQPESAMRDHDSIRDEDKAASRLASNGNIATVGVPIASP
jgi:hypothetical protein